MCTTELGYMAKLEPEFTSATPSSSACRSTRSTSHRRWAKDIEETQGAAVNYPMIGDPDLKVAKLYDMLPADEAGTSDGRTAANNATVRSVFIIGPDKKIKLMLTYPMTTGRNFDEILRVLDSMQLTAEAQGGDAGELEAGRGRDHRRLGLRRGREEEVPAGLEDAQAVPAHRRAAEVALPAAV